MDKRRREMLRDHILEGRRGGLGRYETLELLDHIDALEREVEDARAFVQDAPWREELPLRKVQ